MEFWVFLLCISFLMGFATRAVAKKLGREPFPWFCAGFFFGLMGLLVLLLMPKRKMPTTPLPKEPPTVQPLDTSWEAPYKEALWFYLDSTHTKTGPLHFFDLLHAWTEGKVAVKSYVWKEGMKEWQQVHGLPELRSLLEREELRISS